MAERGPEGCHPLASPTLVFASFYKDVQIRSDVDSDCA